MRRLTEHEKDATIMLNSYDELKATYLGGVPCRQNNWSCFHLRRLREIGEDRRPKYASSHLACGRESNLSVPDPL